MCGQAGSRPLSTATTASAELGGYGAALEDVLAWLLEAEERLDAAPPPAQDLPELKDQFHSHEVPDMCLYHYFIHFRVRGDFF